MTAGPAGSGTRLCTTFALDGTAAFRLGCRPAAPGVDIAFGRTVAALDRYLA